MAIGEFSVINLLMFFGIGFLVGFLVPFSAAIIRNVDVRVWANNAFYAALGSTAGWQAGIPAVIIAALGIYIGTFVHMRCDGIDIRNSSRFGMYASLNVILTGTFVFSILK